MKWTGENYDCEYPKEKALHSPTSHHPTMATFTIGAKIQRQGFHVQRLDTRVRHRRLSFRPDAGPALALLRARVGGGSAEEPERSNEVRFI